MGNIVITGCTGFIGKKLLNYIVEHQLLKTEQVVVLGSIPVDGMLFLPHNNYAFSKEDFLSLGINSIDAVIHLGAFIPKTAAETNNYDQNLSNVYNTAYLLANLPSVPERFVFISTVDVYTGADTAIDESAPTVPQTFYGNCKLFCEQIVLQWCTTHHSIPQILRLGHIYGPGEEAFKKLIPETIRKILKNEAPVIYSSGLEKRSYLHVSDCVAAIMQAVTLKTYPGPINIASSTAITVKDLINKLVVISGKKLETEILNKDIPVRDVLFKNDKMQQLLHKEEKHIDAGLEEEFHSFA